MVVSVTLSRAYSFPWVDITLVLYGHNVSLEVLDEVQLIVAVSLAWWLSASSTA